MALARYIRECKSIFNQRTIMVPTSAFDDARELLHQFLIVDAGFISEDMISDKANVWEKIRIAVELLFGGWCVPRSIRRTRL
jgi:hypothetical protein